MPTPPLSHSAKVYEERQMPDDRTTRRLPAARFAPWQNAVHTLPLSPPYPDAEVLQHQGGQPPDAGLTHAWPWGAFEITT